MTYDELVVAIQSYTENQFPDVYLADGSTEDSTTQINRFIQQAEQRIYNTIQFPSLRSNRTGQCSSGNPYLSCPGDFLSVYAMAVIDASGTYTYLLNKDSNFIREAYPSTASADYGIPKYYALFGATIANNAPTNELTFILGPTPDYNYDVQLQYFYYPVSISDSTNNPSGTTWLGDNFDTVLLYGSLVEAYTFMKGEADIIAGYDVKYKEALALAKRLGDGMERGDAYRDGQYKQAVT